jgi:hypothetical protein
VTETKIRIENPPVVLHTRPALEMDEEQLFEFCRINRGFVLALEPIWEPGL